MNETLDRKKLRWMYMFIASSLCYVIWRWSLFIVWDDTSSASFNIYTNNGYFSYDNFYQILIDSLSNIQGDGYRPISGIIRAFGSAYVLNNGVNPQFFILLNGLLFGLSVVIFYQFTGFFLKTEIARYLSMFIFFASSPVLTGGLVLFSGIQFFVYIYITSILAAYFSYNRKNELKYLVLIIFLLLTGPFIREFIGIAPLLIVINEIALHKRIRPVGLVALIGFGLFLFPTFLPSLFFEKLPIVFVFKMGNLGAFISSGDHVSLSDVLYKLHWRIFFDLLSILPPTMMLLGIGFYLRNIKQSVNTQCVNMVNPSMFLICFFLFSFIPFLKIFNEQVHLAYALIPVSIFISLQFENFYLNTFKAFTFKKKFFIGSIFMVLLFDHAMNIYSTRLVTRSIYSNIITISAMLRKEIPADSIIISNAHHIEDIRLYSNGYFEPWNVGGGIPDKSKWLTSVDDFSSHLNKWIDKNIYFLDVRIPSIYGQRGGDRIHYFVRDNVIEMNDIGQISYTSVIYPFFDPLRLLLPTIVTVWPGPPDLEFDFYRGPELNGEPFLKEVNAEYHLYKVTGKNVYSWTQPTLLVQDYYSMNIIGYKNTIYSIPQNGGAFDVNKCNSNGYVICYIGKDVDSVKKQILKNL
jgi:hypothetical protein